MCLAEPEPVKGLPETPPEGERILWQGAPNWRRMARRIFWTRGLAIYFGLAALALAYGAALDGGASAAVAAAAALGAMAAIVIGLLSLIAYANATATVYTITTRRVVLRHGVALDLSINVPFAKVGAASVKPYADGGGELALSIAGRDRFSYLMLWPHAKPWAFSRPEPMLRCIDDVEAVAKVLADALIAAQTAEAGAESELSVEPGRGEAERPAGDRAPVPTPARAGDLAAAREAAA